MRGTGTTSGGEQQVVQVQGGQIFRQGSGRKDRHSKVYTAKGPRERRVRLSAYTAIQFYDIQDRLGYDRPSKAVDWLISKAQKAIQKLNEDQPSLQPMYTPGAGRTDSNSISNCRYSFTHQDNNDPGSFIQPDPRLVNTIKSFFPTSSFNLPDFLHPMPRETFQAQDLGLSLHSYGAENSGNSNIDPGVLFDSHALSQQQILFSQRRQLLHSNSILVADPWPERLPNSDDNRNSDFIISDYGSGFGYPTRIYGDGEPINEDL